MPLSPRSFFLSSFLRQETHRRTDVSGKFEGSGVIRINFRGRCVDVEYSPRYSVTGRVPELWAVLYKIIPYAQHQVRHVKGAADEVSGLESNGTQRQVFLRGDYSFPHESGHDRYA